jgi:hypothetical protein
MSVSRKKKAKIKRGRSAIQKLTWSIGSSPKLS